MFTIRKKFKFEAAHRLETSHSECCQHIHGHSYVVEVFLSSTTLNDDRMVIDFGKVKEMVTGIVESWDHALILKNPTGLKTKSVVLGQNPTAEAMAKYIFDVMFAEFEAMPWTTNRVFVKKVRVHETDTGWAEFEETID